jgi:hypothetical protein
METVFYQVATSSVDVLFYLFGQHAGEAGFSHSGSRKGSTTGSVALTLWQR